MKLAAAAAGFSGLRDRLRRRAAAAELQLLQLRARAALGAQQGARERGRERAAQPAAAEVERAQRAVLEQREERERALVGEHALPRRSIARAFVTQRASTSRRAARG